MGVRSCGLALDGTRLQLIQVAAAHAQSEQAISMAQQTRVGHASVPFNFDVRAVIYSENAPKLEADLHREFAARRVNQVNPRKEFFHITLEEIAGFVQRHHGQIEFTMAAEAADYRKTRAMTA